MYIVGKPKKKVVVDLPSLHARAEALRRQIGTARDHNSLFTFLEIEENEVISSNTRRIKYSEEGASVENSTKMMIVERHSEFREMKDQYHEMNASFEERIAELTELVAVSTKELDNLVASRHTKNEELDEVIRVRQKELDGLALEMEHMIHEFADALNGIYANLGQILNVPRLVIPDCLGSIN